MGLRVTGREVAGLMVWTGRLVVLYVGFFVNVGRTVLNVGLNVGLFVANVGLIPPLLTIATSAHP